MNIKQKQCLLEYLGYYSPENSKAVNNIDVIWGPASKEATKKFQQDYGLIADGIFGPATEKKIREVVQSGEEPGINWDRVKYFTRDEFKCPCSRCGGFPVEPNPMLVGVADRVREHFDSAAIVSSGVRCQEHNDELPGSVPNSRHVSGKAMDFRVADVKGKDLLEYVWKQPEIRYAYLIEGNWVHMDVL
jgi:hypothetical protein